jgi:hypothetical protein
MLTALMVLISLILRLRDCQAKTRLFLTLTTTILPTLKTVLVDVDVFENWNFDVK